jgi:hypothetical protein
LVASSEAWDPVESAIHIPHKMQNRA